MRHVVSFIIAILLIFILVQIVECQIILDSNRSGYWEDGGDCSTLSYSDENAGDDQNFGYESGMGWVATQFTTVGALTACKISVRLKKATDDDSPNFVVTAHLFTTSGSDPGSNLGTSSTTYGRTDITISYVWYEFVFSDVSLSATTTYFVAMQASTLGDFGDYPIYQLSTTAPPYYTRKSSDGSSWSSVAYATTLMLRIYE